MPGMDIFVICIGVSVVYMAVCIWLTVRVINRRERRAKWSLAVLLSTPTLYFTSVPARLYLANHGLLPEAVSQVICVVQYPIGFVFNGGAPDWLRDILVRY